MIFHFFLLIRLIICAQVGKANPGQNKVLLSIHEKGRMTMNMKSIMTGITVGMALGGATAYIKGAMAGSSMKKAYKKKAAKAAKTMGHMLDDVQYLFK